MIARIITPLMLGLMLLLPRAIAVAEMDSAEFGEIVQQAAIKLQAAAQKRSFRLKYMNDSLEKTALASRALVEHVPFQQVYALLKEARDSYADNYFTYLLESILAHNEGDEASANQLMEKFLGKSQTHTKFEQAFINKQELDQLRKTVFLILQTRGYEVDLNREANTIRLFVASFFSCLIGLGLFWGAKHLWYEYFRPLPVGYRRCPYCRAGVETLMLECLNCRRKLPS